MSDQADFDVVPLSGIGPVRLGMMRQDVRSALPAPVVSFARWQAEPDSTDAFLGNAFQVDYDASGGVEYIELSRGGPFTVRYKGVSLFDTEAERIIGLVSLDAPYDETDPELGSSYIFPSLAMSLWREDWPGDDSDEPDRGQFFDTVGVGKAGYYDRYSA